MIIPNTLKLLFAKKKKFDKSIVMFRLPSDIKKEVINICKNNIIDEALNDEGRDEDSHITIKWGLLTNDIEDFKDFFNDTKPIEIELGEISLFEQDDQDVIKIDIKSSALHRLNKKITDAFENETTYKDYKPHITLCYIKKGKCPESLLGKCKLTGKKIIIDKIIFQNQYGEDKVFKLK